MRPAGVRSLRVSTERLAACLIVALLTAGCQGGLTVDEDVLEVAENVLTLQGGTVSALRDRHGMGPFRRYEVPPETLLTAVEAAAGRARSRGGHPVRAVFRSDRRLEVVAKERSVEERANVSYRGGFLSVMLAVIHRIEGEPEACRLEIHETHRGPFHLGAVSWKRDMPRWIRAELRRVPSPVRVVADTRGDSLETASRATAALTTGSASDTAGGDNPRWRALQEVLLLGCQMCLCDEGGGDRRRAVPALGAEAAPTEAQQRHTR